MDKPIIDLETLLKVYNLKKIKHRHGWLLLTMHDNKYYYINNKWECIKPIDIKRVKDNDLFYTSNTTLRIALIKYIEKGGKFSCRKTKTYTVK